MGSEWSHSKAIGDEYLADTHALSSGTNRQCTGHPSTCCGRCVLSGSDHFLLAKQCNDCFELSSASCIVCARLRRTLLHVRLSFDLHSAMSRATRIQHSKWVLCFFFSPRLRRNAFQRKTIYSPSAYKYKHCTSHCSDATAEHNGNSQSHGPVCEANIRTMCGGLFCFCCCHSFGSTLVCGCVCTSTVDMTRFGRLRCIVFKYAVSNSPSKIITA